MAEAGPATERTNATDLPFIYICATMWHETEEEMVLLLTSLLRLDKNKKDKENSKSPVEYDFEAHIYFDDAMGFTDGQTRMVNDFVRTLAKAVSTATRKMYGESVQLEPPIRTSTPYGGRLMWKMPGGCGIVAHLKDKSLIKNKKRWSQVMSVRYLLQYHALAQNRQHLLSSGRLHILHLDGDTDFQPEALSYALFRMEEEDRNGAVSARIHPTGKGWLVWLQKFEYATGLWLLKTAEDVTGCVLCSPGCFSLIKGLAFLEIVDQFSVPSVTASHLLEQEQGEDRWLTSLLIQSGWNTCYSPLSQCYTHAPEQLDELLKQRRRWVPSAFIHSYAMARHPLAFLKRNTRMTLVYIVYQTLVFMTTLILSSISILVIAASINTFITVDVPFSTIALGVYAPVGAFGVVALIASQDIQMKVVKVLAVVYGLLQVLLVANVVFNAIDETVCAPPVLLALAVIASVIFAGIMHFDESYIIFYGFAYFFCIPLLHVFTLMYAVSNMHITSWGTRETKEDEQRALDIASDTTSVWNDPESATSTDRYAWMRDESLGNGPVQRLKSEEKSFIKDLITNYLKPEQPDVKRQEKISRDLRILRNFTVGILYGCNMSFTALGLVVLKTTFVEVNGLCGVDGIILDAFFIVAIAIFGLTFFVQFVSLVIHRVKSAVRVIRAKLPKKSVLRDLGNGNDAPDKKKNYDALYGMADGPCDIVINDANQRRSPETTDISSNQQFTSSLDSSDQPLVHGNRYIAQRAMLRRPDQCVSLAHDSSGTSGNSPGVSYVTDLTPRTFHRPLTHKAGFISSVPHTGQLAHQGGSNLTQKQLPRFPGNWRLGNSAFAKEVYPRHHDHYTDCRPLVHKACQKKAFKQNGQDSIFQQAREFGHHQHSACKADRSLYNRQKWPRPPDRRECFQELNSRALVQQWIKNNPKNNSPRRVLDRYMYTNNVNKLIPSQPLLRPTIHFDSDSFSSH